MQYILCSLGKLHKNKYTGQYDGRFPVLNLLEMGVNHLDDDISEYSDIYDAVEQCSLLHLIEEISNGIFTKTPLYKDATASGPQMLALILGAASEEVYTCLLYTSPSPRDRQKSRMPSSA
eukprot:TRINITY_DN137_c0_g1_i11.p6 TRINITY_DN137_c0_g1~~TRINITY_DN137_c0_g1_i11.p6  ORF type:complete len:120 (+),score=13.81 TRINITY_DN137_c0_g1_i11:843-1202(+)